MTKRVWQRPGGLASRRTRTCRYLPALVQFLWHLYEIGCPKFSMKKSVLSGLEANITQKQWFLILCFEFYFSMSLLNMLYTCGLFKLSLSSALKYGSFYWRNAASDREVAFGRHSNDLRFAPGHGKGVGGKHLDKNLEKTLLSQTYFIYLQWCRISLIKSSGQVGCLQNGIFSCFYNPWMRSYLKLGGKVVGYEDYCVKCLFKTPLTKEFLPAIRILVVYLARLFLEVAFVTLISPRVFWFYGQCKVPRAEFGKKCQEIPWNSSFED